MTGGKEIVIKNPGNPIDSRFRKPDNQTKSAILADASGRNELDITENVRVSRIKLLREWESNRKAGNIQAGCILATYADMFLPIKNGRSDDTLYRAFSFQFRDFLNDITATDDRDFIIYDYPFFEESYSKSTANPFLYFTDREFVGQDDYLNFDAFHVGLLSQTALQRIVEATNGRGWLVDALINTSGLVFYRPADYIWYAVDSWENLVDEESKKKNRPLLAAAAATIIDML